MYSVAWGFTQDTPGMAVMSWWRQADPGHGIARRECRLFDLREEVFRIAVQGHRADLDQRIIPVRPGLGQVERVEAVVLRFGIRHYLHRQVPPRKVSALDRVEQVATVEIGVLARHGGG